MFTSPTTRDLERMAELGAEVRPFVRPDAMAHVPYNAWRYFLYREFLDAAQDVIGHIMLTDVRDVVFQRDPAEFPWDRGLHVFQEDARMRVLDCEHMRRWVAGHLGEQALQDLADEQILCSGITVGDADSVREYVRTMCSGLLPFTPGVRMAGYDQGLHNHLLRRGVFEKVKVHDNAGPVLTLGYRKEGAAMNAAGDMLGENGATPLVVHQYDRHPALFRAVRERW